MKPLKRLCFVNENYSEIMRQNEEIARQLEELKAKNEELERANSELVNDNIELQNSLKSCIGRNKATKLHGI